MFFEAHIQKSVIVQLHRAVGSDSKLKLSHSPEKTAQLLEMLKQSKDANKTIRSIQNIITNSKRSKQTDHPKTTLTLDSDKQKQTLRKTRKRRTKCYHKHAVGCKTKLQNSKTLTKQNSKTQTQQGLQKLSKNTKNRDRHKIHKTR